MSTRTPPSTELRNLYWFLRESSLRYVLNPLQSMACPSGEPSEQATSLLAGLFTRSFKQFSEYKNITEEFRPSVGKRKDGADKQKFAQEIVRLLRKDPEAIEVAGDTIPLYVDREISPIRTTRANVPATGAGGLDFLAASRDATPRPIIGEVKADNDRTPLFALVQALTYSTELATPYQRERLSQHYPQRLPKATGKIELLLVVEASNSEEKRRRYDQVCEFAQALMRESAVSNKIARISFWWGKVDEHGGSFETTIADGS